MVKYELIDGKMEYTCAVNLDGYIPGDEEDFMRRCAEASAEIQRHKAVIESPNVFMLPTARKHFTGA